MKRCAGLDRQARRLGLLKRHHSVPALPQAMSG
jgi:hypothetical protein